MVEHDEPGIAGHPSDGALLGRLDGALATREETEVAAHLERCDACRARLASLDARSAAVRVSIREADPEPPLRETYDLAPRAGRRVRDRWAVAAAAAAVLVAGAVSATLLQRVLSDDAEPAPEPVSGSAAQGPETAATSFVPTGAELVIAFETQPAGGTVTLRPATGRAATLRVGSQDAELLVEGALVHVRNPGTARVAYELAVPASVRVVRIRRPGVPDIVEDVAGLSARRTISLPQGG